MKILMAAMSMGLGGAETHVLELARALTARGHEVTVASAGGIYAEKLPLFGVKHEKIPLNSKSPFALARAFDLLSRLLEREKFDIVHAHARIPAFILGRLKKKYGFAFVTTVHFDFRVTPVLRRISNWGERTLAVSADLADSAAEKYGLEREKITVICNGIDTARFSPAVSGRAVRERFGFEGKTVIMYLGRLDGDSFLPARALLEAAGEIHSEHSRAVFLIVGDGEKKRELSLEARRINAALGEETVFLPGGTDAPEEYFAACDIFVGPSRSALEALACGKPSVLAGNFGMLGVFSPETANEALRTNFCCRGSEGTTAERLAAEVSRLLLLSESERKALALFGRRFIENNYSTAAMAEACEAEYRSLLAERGKKAVLCGYYGAGNAGDEAMLAVLVSALKSNFSLKKITVISSNPRKTEAEHGTLAVARGDIEAISHVLAEADVLIFGGGNILQDKTSTRSLLYYAQIARMAKKHACRVFFSANGIGPIIHRRNMNAVKKTLEGADYISMRDERSRSLAAQLLNGREIFSSGELAFLCERERAEEKRRCFAVFPKSVEKFRFGELVKFCRYMKRKYGLMPVFAPMHGREDTRLCKSLAEKTGGALCISLKNAMHLASAVEFTVCMRLHAAVFSAAALTPVIAVSDDEKTASLMLGSGACVFGADASAASLCCAAKEILLCKEEKKKLLESFYEEQRMLAKAELLRLAEYIF